MIKLLSLLSQYCESKWYTSSITHTIKKYWMYHQLSFRYCTNHQVESCTYKMKSFMTIFHITKQYSNKIHTDVPLIGNVLEIIGRSRHSSYVWCKLKVEWSVARNFLGDRISGGAIYTLTPFLGSTPGHGTNFPML